MARRKRDKKEQTAVEMTPEFGNWLKDKGVKARTLRKSPDKLQEYYQEWQKANKPRRRSLLQLPKLPKINLNAVSERVNQIHDILSTISSLKEAFGKSKME
ncbi:hypothetical protein [Brevibacillus massiliensis]|jgi:hypothetical protein|uniref:hypothetical protein n=1 Tax=Brevibacillus massiliensis TaxID=1118054 RepID=UPI0002EBF6E0|nr:hypothetical protein [Brevibacillus massiliensis]